MPNYIEWNGISSLDLGLTIEKYPNMNRPARKYTVADVPGRNGSAYILQDAWNETVQSYEISAKDPVSAFKGVAEWLHSAKGFAVLRDSYDPDIYRLAVCVNSFDVKNSLGRAGRALIQFNCRPERYLVTEDIERTAPNSTPINNESSHVAHPLIKIIGRGSQSLLRLTDRVDSKLTQSTAVGRVPGIAPPNTALKTLWGLKLVTGGITADPTWVSDVNIARDTVSFSTSGTATGLGFNIPVDPNSEYTISFNCLSATTATFGGVYAYCCNEQGDVESGRVSSASPGGSGVIHVTTTSRTRWLVLILAGTVNGGRIVIGNIQVCAGSDAQPYAPSVDDTSSVFTFGDCVIAMSELNGDMFIDCETMNAYGSFGENLNKLVTITDAYGNPTVKFPRLELGDNDIELNGEDWITKIVVTPRYWTL